ncbi:BrnT family toxin [Endozoicomonas ascidiicola]|uniref:BrnT family toxin n=1 Tax=Endozoicomonas ascidiicola TaxID=1698521 RepID=UPI00082F6CD1|nr:BrnT family toxin [Endozoicomonas ascidiicola]
MFEYDLTKSLSNQEKHGIDFTQAQSLWEDENREVIKAMTSEEPRFLLIAKYTGKHWTAVFTPRNDKIRIISVRRSRPKEIAAYES